MTKVRCGRCTEIMRADLASTCSTQMARSAVSVEAEACGKTRQNSICMAGRHLLEAVYIQCFSFGYRIPSDFAKPFVAMQASSAGCKCIQL